MHVLAVVPAAVAGFEPNAARALIERAVATLFAARPVSRCVVVGGQAWLAEPPLPHGVRVVAPRVAGGAAGDTGGSNGAPGDAAAALASALADAEADGFAPALAVLLDPTCPFIDAGCLEAAVQHLRDCGADCLLTVHAPGGPVWQTTADGGAAPVARADGAATYVENGALAVCRVGAFLAADTLPAGRVVLFPVPAIAGLRLSAEAESWVLAEALVAGRRRTQSAGLLARVQLLVFDFDGVMTDNRVVVFEDGREAVLCNRSDGLGLERLRAAGVPLAVISKERNPVVGARCRKLNIPCHQGIEDKLAVLTALAAERRLDLADVAYVGNDINDLACLTAVGVPIAPADAYPEVLAVARVVTRAAGGAGAVREIADLLLAAAADRPNAGGDGGRGEAAAATAGRPDERSPAG